MANRIRFLFMLSCLVLGLASCGDDDDAATDTGSEMEVGGDTSTDVEETTPYPDATVDVPLDLSDASPETDDTGGFEGFPIGEPGPITNLQITGLDERVEIKFTEDGIPSILCQTDEDCAAALGYLHARDRFGQMDIRRRVVRGRLSEIVSGGQDVLDIDLALRTLYSTADGRPIEEVALTHASDKTIGLLEAYSNGVNSWLDDLTHHDNGASLPDEYGFIMILLGDEIAPWTPVDSVATVAALIEQLTNDGGTDLSFGEVFSAIEADPTYDLSVFDDYFRPRPFSDSTTIDDFTYPDGSEKSGDLTRANQHLTNVASTLREARLVLEQLDAILGAGQDRGSNNWVVGPDLTADGNPLLSNDPHLGFTNPATWYAVHMDAVTNGEGDIHVAGFSFAGLPWVIIGQNETIAWGVTNSSFDFSDVYVEQLNDDNSAVIFEGSEVPLVVVENTFPQAIGPDVTGTSLYVPHHGPVLAIDEETGTAVSLRWTGNTISTDVNVLTELNRSSTVAEARDAVRSTTTIGQNWVIIDTAGDFGWFPYNTVPIRPWASAAQPAFLPLDGTGGQEWEGFVALEDLPQALNPTEGYLATANNDMTGANLDGDPANDGYPVLQSYPSMGIRHERIVDRLEESDSHTTATMLDIVGDTYSIIGELVSPQLLTVDRAGLSANAQAIYDAIDSWAFECPTGLATSDPSGDPSSDEGERSEALGCAAFHRVLGDVYVGWSADERSVNDWARGPSLSSLLRALVRPDELTNPDLFWDDVSTEDVTETQDDILRQAFEDAALQFEELVGDDPTDWLWGRVHTMTLAADLFSSLGLASYDQGPFATDGGLNTVNVANPSVGAASMNIHAGPSMRLICEAPEAGVGCSIQLPGGQPHFRSDDNYVGMIERWLVNEPTDLVFDHAGLDAPAIVVTPIGD